MAPIDAKTEEDLLALPLNGLNLGGKWSFVVTSPSEVYFMGDDDMFKVARSDFDEFVKWYTTGETRFPNGHP